MVVTVAVNNIPADDWGDPLQHLQHTCTWPHPDLQVQIETLEHVHRFLIFSTSDAFEHEPDLLATADKSLRIPCDMARVLHLPSL